MKKCIGTKEFLPYSAGKKHAMQCLHKVSIAQGFILHREMMSRLRIKLINYKTF